MRFNIYRLHADGRAELLQRGMTAEAADSYRRHPSMHGVTTVVVPEWADVPSFA